jgi:Uncharacterised nucleotidyltransferase
MKLLARALADPSSVLMLNDAMWIELLCTAHAERLAATLAVRVEGLDIPERAASVLRNAQLGAEAGRVRALWEVEMCRRALASLDVPVVLLKGSAFLAAGLSAGQGRLVGDLDILVPRDRLDEVETAILTAGWEWLKTDAYDDHYYRTWMHELPPMIHRDRDAMIDIHHTILPLTARPKPDAAAMISESLPLANGLHILCPEDMVIHAAAHLFADGDLSGGLRNLWDIHCLIGEFAEMPDFWARLQTRAGLHGLKPPVFRALRLSRSLFGTVIPKELDRWDRQDKWYVARILARDGWGRETHKFVRFVLYVRSHMIRMPLPMLMRHLWTKWRKPV